MSENDKPPISNSLVSNTPSGGDSDRERWVEGVLSVQRELVSTSCRGGRGGDAYPASVFHSARALSVGPCVSLC
jgi:hypothetical protein